MRYIFIICTLLISSISFAQNNSKFKIEGWRAEKIDSKYDTSAPTKSGDIIAKYKPAVDSLLVPIGKSNMLLEKHTPESPLSNLAVDIIKKYADSYLEREGKDFRCHVGLTNFGGIRADLPEGDITTYDVYSVFPFDNRIVIVTMPGHALLELMTNFAKRGRCEALSGVEIVIKDRVLEKCLINGKAIDKDETYYVATIDFLLNGGDSVYALQYNKGVINTNVKILDAVIEYIKEEDKNGRVITAKKDGRVKIINSKN